MSPKEIRFMVYGDVFKSVSPLKLPTESVVMSQCVGFIIFSVLVVLVLEQHISRRGSRMVKIMNINAVYGPRFLIVQRCCGR